ncbi:hypothetical protein HK405_008943 [Cladochytrium tenue]|nr:hypothetical protein HK405_008943 [Cladochytrium tenue]
MGNPGPKPPCLTTFAPAPDDRTSFSGGGPSSIYGTATNGKGSNTRDSSATVEFASFSSKPFGLGVGSLGYAGQAPVTQQQQQQPRNTAAPPGQLAVAASPASTTAWPGTWASAEATQPLAGRGPAATSSGGGWRSPLTDCGPPQPQANLPRGATPALHGRLLPPPSPLGLLEPRVSATARSGPRDKPRRDGVLAGDGELLTGTPGGETQRRGRGGGRSLVGASEAGPSSGWGGGDGGRSMAAYGGAAGREDELAAAVRARTVRGVGPGTVGMVSGVVGGQRDVYDGWTGFEATAETEPVRAAGTQRQSPQSAECSLAWWLKAVEAGSSRPLRLDAFPRRRCNTVGQNIFSLGLGAHLDSPTAARGVDSSSTLQTPISTTVPGNSDWAYEEQQLDAGWGGNGMSLSAECQNYLRPSQQLSSGNVENPLIFGRRRSVSMSLAAGQMASQEFTTTTGSVASWFAEERQGFTSVTDSWASSGGLQTEQFGFTASAASAVTGAPSELQSIQDAETGEWDMNIERRDGRISTVERRKSSSHSQLAAVPAASSGMPAGFASSGTEAEGRAPAPETTGRRVARQRLLNPPAGNLPLELYYARYFVIKSFTEDDVFRSIKYGIWASTDLGNRRLSQAYRDASTSPLSAGAVGGTGGACPTQPVVLFFSVNASGHFCGVATMESDVDWTRSSPVWAQGSRWRGVFVVRWIYVKDIPNSVLRHLRVA